MLSQVYTHTHTHLSHFNTPVLAGASSTAQESAKTVITSGPEAEVITHPGAEARLLQQLPNKGGLRGVAPGESDTDMVQSFRKLTQHPKHWNDVAH